jgi:hypothetical protein
MNTALYNEWEEERDGSFLDIMDRVKEKIAGHVLGNLGETLDSTHCRFITLKIKKADLNGKQR